MRESVGGRVSECVCGGTGEWVGAWMIEWVEWVSEWTSQSVSGWVSEWASERVSGWLGGSVSEWVSGWVGGWVSGWVGAWVSGWMSVWVGEWLSVSGWVSGWMSEWVGWWMSEWVGGWVGDWVSALVSGRVGECVRGWVSDWVGGYPQTGPPNEKLVLCLTDCYDSFRLIEAQHWRWILRGARAALQQRPPRAWTLLCRHLRGSSCRGSTARLRWCSGSCSSSCPCSTSRRPGKGRNRTCADRRWWCRTGQKRRCALSRTSSALTPARTQRVWLLCPPSRNLSGRLSAYWRNSRPRLRLRGWQSSDPAQRWTPTKWVRSPLISDCMRVQSCVGHRS